LQARQVPHLALAYVVDFRQLTATSGADQTTVSRLAPYPQLEPLASLIDLVLIYPVARPPQELGPVVLSHPLILSRDPQIQNLHKISPSPRFLLRAVFCR